MRIHLLVLASLAIVVQGRRGAAPVPVPKRDIARKLLHPHGWGLEEIMNDEVEPELPEEETKQMKKVKQGT